VEGAKQFGLWLAGGNFRLRIINIISIIEIFNNNIGFTDGHLLNFVSQMPYSQKKNQNYVSDFSSALAVHPCC